jgi:hypothetical protein
MQARLIVHDKVKEADGSIIEIKIWSVSVSEEKKHGFRYSLAYIKDGDCLVCYDNHTGKGDHRHYMGREEHYRFTTITKLLEDFYKDIRRFRP